MALSPESVRARLQSLFPLAGSPAPLIRIGVVSGPQVGAEAVVAAGVLTVGSDSNADIILFDPAVHANHAEFALSGARLRVSPRGAPVHPADGVEVPPGTSRWLPLPAEIGVGGSVIAVSAATGSSSRLPLRALAITGLAVTLLALGSLESGRIQGAAPATASIGPSGTGPMPLPTPTPVGSAERIGAGAEAAASLRARLRTEAWASGLDVRSEGSMVVVEGHLDPSAAERWAGVQAWFDAHHGAVVLLRAAFARPAEDGPPALDIQTVSYGTHPYVVLRDGTRHGVGAILNDGWTLGSITADAVTLVRGDRRLVLTF